MFVNDVFDFLRDVAKLCTEYKFSLSCFWGCFESYYRFVGEYFSQCWVFEDWFPVFVNDVFDFLRNVAKLCTEYKFSLSCFCFPSECLWLFREVYVVDFFEQPQTLRRKTKTTQRKLIFSTQFCDISKLKKRGYKANLLCSLSFSVF